MSLLRRRMMMANSHAESGGESYDEVFGDIPPESTEFGWPLYITVPYSLSDGNVRSYKKDSSDITSQLWDWCMENKVLVEEFLITKSYESYPPELYINGVRINTMSCDEEFGNISFWLVVFDNHKISAALYDDFSITIDVIQ